MIQKVISGGQTGVDRAALDAAIEHTIPVGGSCGLKTALFLLTILSKRCQPPITSLEPIRTFWIRMARSYFALMHRQAGRLQQSRVRRQAPSQY
jgi:hypothetical protein